MLSPGLLVNLCWSFHFEVESSCITIFWVPEDGGGLTDVVQTERGTWPLKRRKTPQEGDLLVHRRDRPAVRHRHRPGHDAQELLRWQERLCGSRHLELVDSMHPQRDETEPRQREHTSASGDKHPSSAKPFCRGIVLLNQFSYFSSFLSARKMLECQKETTQVLVFKNLNWHLSALCKLDY